MNQEITLERRGDAIHLVYRHYGDSFFGTFLANRLRLAGIPPPANGGGNGHPPGETNGHAVKDLELGQFYLFESGDGEMHALLSSDQLAELEQAVVHDLHIPVTAGADLLPAALPAPAVPAQDRARHSPGQILRCIILGLFLLAILGACGLFVWRAVAPEELSMATLIARLEAPSPEAKGGLGTVIRQWMEARNVAVPLTNVLFLTETKLVMADGAFVVIDGAGDLRGLAELAAREKSPPILEARLDPTLSQALSATGSDLDGVEAGGLPLKRIHCGRATFAETGTLKPIVLLTPSTGRPARSQKPDDDAVYRIVTDLRFDERRTFTSLVGHRISLRGRIVTEESGRVLRLANGTGVALAPLPAESHVEPFLAGMAGDKTEIQVDMTLERAFPWRNAKTPAESREATQIVGMGHVVGVSADGLYLTDAR